MAVASDIPQLENRQQYKHAANSYLYDDHWRPIGLFAPPDHVVLDNYDQVSPAMRDAIIAIEDKRFLSDPGVDIRGIARAFISDVTGGATQGASTITEQFVKNALQAQNNRTILEKLREAALAYHLTRKWSKQKILTEYLNSIYFGNGANGVESAARVYFGKVHGYDSQAAPGESRCGDSTPALDLPKCAKVLTYWEAALLAGMVANPSAFNPFEHPHAALGAPQPRPQGHAAAALHQPACSTSTASAARCRRSTTSSSRPSRPRRRTSRAGCGRRSCWRWA